MRITYLYQSDGYSLAKSRGANIHILSILQSLQKLGHSARLMTLYNRKIAYSDNISSFISQALSNTDFCKVGISNKRGYLFFESGIRRLQRISHLPYLALFDSFRILDACRLNLADTDIIHERYNLLSIGGSLASRNINKPLILEINADLIQERKIRNQPLRGLQYNYAVWSTHFILGRAKTIIAVSDELQQHLIDRWSVPANKIVVMPNAADIDVFNQNFDQRIIRHSLGLGQEPVVIFIGGFYIWQDLDLLIDSFKQVLSVVPDTKLLLVGDGETRLKIEQHIQRLGISHAVMFTGLVEHHKIPELLSIATIAVAPFLPVQKGNGYSPLKLFEYMAAGKPIIATDTGQVTKIINHKNNGILINPGDIDGFAKEMKILLQNPPYALKLGEQARQDAVKKHSWEEYAQQLVGIYQAVLNEARHQVS